MDQETRLFKENVDDWIKQISSQFSELNDIFPAMVENRDNTEHNYELIYELKDQLDELRNEINTLKIIQLISLKKQGLLKRPQ